MLDDYPFFKGTKPRVVGHRGASGESPENTLPAFRKAFEAGAEFVELDVRGSKEGHVVIVHDATLERTTNGRGRVKEKTLLELKALDAGYWFTPDGGASYPFRERNIALPTLEEYFLAFPLARAIIEIKQASPSIVPSVIDVVRRLGRQGHVLLATEKDSVMEELRRNIRESGLSIATGFSYGEVAAFFYWVRGGKKGAFLPPGQAFQIPPKYNDFTLVSDETVGAAHELATEMFVWTINDPEEMKRLLRLGVDGLITDYPARLRDLSG